MPDSRVTPLGEAAIQGFPLPPFTLAQYKTHATMGAPKGAIEV
jgi:hypothetical protein